MSGLKLNQNKTEGMLIGKSKINSIIKIQDVIFKPAVKALGTVFGINQDECEVLNWENKFVIAKP